MVNQKLVMLIFKQQEVIMDNFITLHKVVISINNFLTLKQYIHV